MEYVNFDLLIACISSICALLIACITYYQTKKIKFFEAYFNKKAQAYEKFFSLIDISEFTNDLTLEFHKSLKVICLYCAGNDLEVIKKFTNAILELNSTSKDSEDYEKKFDEYVMLKNQTLTLLRQDLDRCKKFKFY